MRPSAAPSLPFNRAPSRAVAAPPPPRPRAAVVVLPQRPFPKGPLAQWLLLSILLHVLGILLFGAPAGGSREGRAMFGSLSVMIVAPPEPAPQLRLAPELTLAPLKQQARVERRPRPAPLPPPPLGITRQLETPAVVPKVIERLVPAERKPDVVPPPQVPPPTVEQQVPPPTVEQEVPPPTVEQQAPPPVVKEAPPLPPAAPVTEVKPVEAPPLPAPPLPAPPVEVQAPKPVPPEPIRSAPPVPEPIREPPKAEAVREPPPRVPDAQPEPPPPKPAAPLVERALPKLDAPASAFRPRLPGSDAAAPAPSAPADYDPTAAPPSVDLDAARRRAGQLAREGTGNRALLPFAMPPVQKPKSKLESAIENARKPDCRTAYKDLGLAAVVPLIANEFGEGNCRW